MTIIEMWNSWEAKKEFYLAEFFYSGLGVNRTRLQELVFGYHSGYKKSICQSYKGVWSYSPIFEGYSSKRVESMKIIVGALVFFSFSSFWG